MRTKQEVWWTEAYRRASNICCAGGHPSSERDAEEVKRKLARLLGGLTRHFSYDLDASEFCAVCIEAINDAVHDTGWAESVKLTI